MKYLQLSILLSVVLLGPQLNAQTTFYKASYFIDKEKAQDQYYTLEQKGEILKVQERGVFLSNPAIYAFAESNLDSQGYTSVEIAFENGNINSNVLVKRSDKNSNLFYSYFNNVLVDSIEAQDSTIILFDGPNPTFDALNSNFLDKRKGQEVQLVLINWINGSLSSEEAYYINGKNETAVHKQRTKRVSFLFFEDTSILPKTCYQGKESYEFKKVDSLPITMRK